MTNGHAERQGGVKYDFYFILFFVLINRMEGTNINQEKR